ncbi:MAG TPA: RagB/SusD family nutrient uptake outer membrane protein [Puia sp.]|nr:RagB/SusD family nutrient uptake outer membrane protein [Puia sp.]
MKGNTVIKHTTIILLFSLAIGACKKDFLAIYPEGQVNAPTFYKTAQDFQQALTGAYAPLRDAANVAFYLEEMRSDNTEYYYDTKDRGGLTTEQIADFLDDKSNGVVSAVWTADYNGIQRINTILDRLQAVTSGISDTVRNQITGESKALRAHYYFELVRLYGAVPLYLHEVTDKTSAFVNRSPVDSVYTQIISDFQTAIGLLGPPSGFPQSGRATKGMAATELGLVYLTRKDYASAVPLLQSVTQMGYSLLPRYADVFKPANKNSQESIFEVQYKAGTDGQQSSFIYIFTPSTPNTTNILGVNFNNGSGGWNVPTQDIVDTYEPADTTRKSASIGVVKGKLNSSVDFIPDSLTSILNPPTTGEESRYFDKKLFNPPYNLLNNTDDNWMVYRYADVLLMLAESLNEQGRTADALPWLNKVRARVNLPPSTATGQDSVRTIIAHERRVELAFENHRWFDLLRTGQAIPVMTAFGIRQKQKYSYLLPASYTITPERLIYAIPFRETQVNPGLTQNPGY